MNHSLKLFPHYLILTGIMILGAVLRFWNLDLKPLWLDEVITALISQGHSYDDVPLQVIFSLSRLKELFTLKPEVSCAEITHILVTQSTHPPLFFCGMHRWLTWVEPITGSLSWAVRSLPALIGVSAIAAIYWLNRIAFSLKAGLVGAAIMAVSPFGVYLSQEARHYTLPILLITLGLIGLVQIQQDISQRRQPRWIVWLSWSVVNSISLYVHYFCVIALIAQIFTLITLFYWQRRTLYRRYWVTASLAIIGIGVSYLPWLPFLKNHFGRPETNWLPPAENIAPLYQTLVGWLLMIIALPAEHQPLWIQIPVAVIMVTFGAWVTWQSIQGWKQLWQTPETQLTALILASFIFWVLLEFFAIVYVLNKDLTVAPRYHFVYFPAVCAWLGATLTRKPELKHAWFLTPASLVLCIGIISCVFVVHDGVFQKPFEPQQVAQDMNLEPTVPLLVVMNYRNSQDLALGLSYDLTLDHMRTQNADTFLAFFPRMAGSQSFWQQLSQQRSPVTQPLNLWVVGHQLKQEDFPPVVSLANLSNCQIDPTQHRRVAIPHQLYRCQGN
jgi:uncharacterized membrane protein